MNLVVYVSDALRTDHVGCYGARYVNTRTIDELAAGGVRFDQAITVAPWTCPSMASMVTGLSPHHHGYFHWDATLDPSLPTLFTTLAAQGYEIASFVFDENYLFKGYADANVTGLSVTLDGAVEWLRARDGSKPFLLFFHSWATHMPYDVLHAERREWLAAKEEIIDGIQSGSAAAYAALREGYTRAVEHASEVLLASFLEELDRLGLRETTALAFVSDHGESWGERFADKADVKGTYHLHGATLNEEIVQVPLILTAPGLEPGVVSSQVRTTDLFPTLAELAGTSVDAIDGASLLPVADGRETGDRVAVLGATDGGSLSQLAVRMPPWKLILRLDTGLEEAYDLGRDPRELSSSPGEAPHELRDLLYRELETAEMREPTAEEEAIVASRLTDLGYL
jgi:arylsulfatase A-like enzyme